MSVIDFAKLRQEHADGYSGPDPATERDQARAAARLEAIHSQVFDEALRLLRGGLALWEVAKLSTLAAGANDTDCYTKLNAICCAYDAHMKEGQ